VVTRNLHLHMVRRRWTREIHDEVRIFRTGMRFSIYEVQAVNLYPGNILMTRRAVNQSATQSDSNSFKLRMKHTL
jgi:hypothetical protein